MREDIHPAEVHSPRTRAVPSSVRDIYIPLVAEHLAFATNQKGTIDAFRSSYASGMVHLAVIEHSLQLLKLCSDLWFVWYNRIFSENILCVS